MVKKDTHHLYFSVSHGWQLRFTIIFDPKKTGKRMKRNLKTRVEREAIVRRDLILAEYDHLGLKIARFDTSIRG